MSHIMSKFSDEICIMALPVCIIHLYNFVTLKCMFLGKDDHFLLLFSKLQLISADRKPVKNEKEKLNAGFFSFLDIQNLSVSFFFLYTRVQFSGNYFLFNFYKKISYTKRLDFMCNCRPITWFMVNLSNFFSFDIRNCSF